MRVLPRAGTPGSNPVPVHYIDLILLLVAGMNLGQVIPKLDWIIWPGGRVKDSLQVTGCWNNRMGLKYSF